jgi:hypothetical protein
MNRIINKSRLSALHAIGAVAFTLVAISASAQDTTTTHRNPGVSQYEANLRNAQIVYVEGNDLVLKLENGKVEHMIVPASEKFIIDGKEVTVKDLKSGTRLTQSVVTTTTPHYVKTVRVLKGKVWHVNAPGSLILTLPDGTNQLFKVPSNAKFIINGKPMTVFDLRKGMKIEATIITDSEHTVVEKTKTNFGYTPAPALPRMFDVLLIQPAPMPAAPQATVTAEHVDPPAEVASTLPGTASSLPLFGLLGSLGIVSSLGLGMARKFAANKA